MNCHQQVRPEVDKQPTCTTARSWIQEMRAALNLATLFYLKTPSVEQSLLSHCHIQLQCSPNLYLWPANLPRHHLRSSSVACMNSRRFHLSCILETPPPGCALLKPFPSSSLPPRHELVSQRQEAAHVPLSGPAHPLSELHWQGGQRCDQCDQGPTADG